MTANILPRPDNITLPINGGDFSRPDPLLIEQLRGVSSATASAMLHRMGIRQTFIEGPKSAASGTKIVGSIITLQFMPQREDVASGIAQEYSEKYSALWAVFGPHSRGRCAGNSSLWRSVYRLFGRNVDHVFQGARRRRHRG